MRLVGLLLAAALLPATSAGAQAYIRADCRPLVAAPNHPADSLDARWYRRFWTGECGGLPGCFPGSPNWNEVVGKLTARSPAARRTAVQAHACKLGSLIGLEWVRPKKVRRIDTGDLRGFNRTLERAADVAAGLDAVEAQARAKLGR